MNYFLQIGDADAPDEASAQGMTSEIKSMMSGLGPGHDLRVSIYPVTDGVRLTLAASAGRALSPSARQAGPSRASQSRSGSVHLVEKTYPLDVQLTHAT